MRKVTKLVIVFLTVILIPLIVMAIAFYAKRGDAGPQIMPVLPIINTHQPTPDSQRISILIVGDLMLDRHVRENIEQKNKNYPFEKIESFLKGNDLTIANLEGSFTDFKPNRAQGSMTFTFDPTMIPILKDLGFNSFNLANNHTLNYGMKGLIQSKNYLKKYNIDYFGDPKNEEEISTIKEINNYKIGLVGYHELDDSGSGLEQVLAEINKLRPEVDYLIVYPHWGYEYQPIFSKIQQNKAHLFVDKGADIVIGSHPHVIQPLEIYHNRVIFYSLGNFLFDQYFSEETQQSLAVKIIIENKEIKYYIYPLRLTNKQITLAGKTEYEKILSTIAKNSVVSQDIKEQIQKGEFSLIE